MTQHPWHMEVDVVAVGSGMGGTCAAIAAQAQGQEAVVLEKADVLGGGTAYSYGIVWVGENHLASALSPSPEADDTRDEAFAYLQHLGAGHQNDANLRAYVDNAPAVLRFFCDDVGIPFYAVPNFPDYYHGMAPGSRSQGRNLQVKPFKAASLGDDRHRLRVAPAVTHRATFEEIASWGGRAKPQGWDRDLIRQRIDQDIRTFGAGLIGHLLHAAFQRGIPMHTDTPIDRLVVDDDRVVGVVAKQNGADLRIRARNAVVLATGSYNRNAALTARFNEIHSGKSVLPPTIEGDGLTVAGEIGAAVKFTPMFQQDLVYAIPGETHDGGPLYRGATNNESGFPHSILVNLDGNRFADESIGQEVGVALRNFDTRRHRYPNVPCFLIFDQTYMDKYGLGSILPGSQPPDWLARSDTIHGLAQSLDINPNGLAETVQRFNQFARAGKDDDFGRGEFPFANSVSGDLTNSPNPNMGPLEQPPYYGLPLTPTATSSAGLMTNQNAQVLHLRGYPIPGLYACGSTAAHYYGIGYQAGCELGGGMTFGYLAVHHASTP